MTAPRRILPGTTYLITRRCTQREFLLRPSPETNQIILYVLGVAVQRTKVKLHTVLVMSDHIHLVLTDPHARLPEFEHFLDGIVARALNRLLGRSQALWDDSGYGAQVLATPEAIVSAAAYTLANPVKAELVESSSEWPGVRLGPESIGKPIVVERPKVFFRADGPFPESVTLELTPPPGFTADAFREAVQSDLECREQEARAAARAAGRRFQGVRRVLAQPTSRRAASPEARGRLRPTVIALDPKVAREELRRRADFLDRYRKARARFVEGFRDVVFPSGTYLLRVAFGVACEAPS